jgi:hypothetical protein
MNDKVKRYDLMQEGEYSQREGVINEVGNGDWVRAEDYDALREEVSRLNDLIADAMSCTKEALSNLQMA